MGDFLEVFKKTLEEGSTGSLENPSASGYSVSEKDRLPGNAKKQFQGSFLDVFASTLKENEAKKLQAETAANAQKNLAGRSEFTRGLLRGIDTLQATYEGGVGMYNAAIGDQAAADRRFANYREQMRQASENPGTVTDFFSTDEKTGAFASPSNFGTYVAGTLGQAVPSLTEAVISGIAGAAVGAAIVPAPDPADVVTVPAGAIGGFLGRNAMRRAIASAAQQYASRGMAQDVAEQTAERYVRQAVANRIASNVGSGLAVSQTTALHEGGGMWAEGMDKGYNSPYSAIGLGQVSGFSEALFGAAPAAVRAVLGKAAVNEAAKELGWKQAAGYAWDVVKNSGEEGVQEAFQEYLGAINQSISDPKFKLYTKENFMQWAEAAAAGAITGGVVGGGSVSLQAIRDRKRQLEEIQSKGFVSESDAQQAGIEGASRRERMANLEAERQELDRQEQELAAQSDQEFIQQQQSGQIPAGQLDEAGGLIPQVSQEELDREFAARMAAQGGNVSTPAPALPPESVQTPAQQNPFEVPSVQAPQAVPVQQAPGGVDTRGFDVYGQQPSQPSSVNPFEFGAGSTPAGVSDVPASQNPFEQPTATQAPTVARQTDMSVSLSEHMQTKLNQAGFGASARITQAGKSHNVVVEFEKNGEKIGDSLLSVSEDGSITISSIGTKGSTGITKPFFSAVADFAKANNVTVRMKDSSKTGITGQRFKEYFGEGVIEKTKSRYEWNPPAVSQPQSTPPTAPLAEPAAEQQKEPWQMSRAEAQAQGWGDNWSSVIRRGVNQGKDVPARVLDELFAYDKDRESKSPEREEMPKAKIGDTVVRYTHKDGSGLLNNNELDRSKLTDAEEAELVELMDLGLQQPGSGTSGVFYFTKEGEQKHKRMIDLLSKASKKGVVRSETVLDQDPSWESEDGQIAVVQKQGRKKEVKPEQSESPASDIDAMMEEEFKRQLEQKSKDQQSLPSDGKPPKKRSPRKKKPSTDKPSQSSQSKEDRKKEIEDLWSKLLSESKKRLPSGLDPELLRIAAQLAIKVIEDGVLTFSEFVKESVANIPGDMLDSLKPYMESAWRTAHRNRMTEDAGGKFDDYMEKPEESQPKANELQGELRIPVAGQPFTFTALHNKEKSPDMGARFGQDKEPAGRYVVAVSDNNTAADQMPEKYDKREVTFQNPLVIDFGGGYQDATNWKQVLSSRYGGLTGKALSEAIRNDGYDGIVTVEPAKGPNRPAHTSEIVDLRTGKKTQKVEPSPVEKPAVAESEVDKTLRQAGLKVEKLADGTWQITGNTYEHSKEIGDVKREIRELGGFWDKYGKRWTFKADPRRAIADRLASKGVGEEPGNAGISDEQVARERARREEDAKADVQTTRDAYVASVDQSTRDLIGRGLKFGMTDEVVSNQIEDIGRVVVAAESGLPMFVIGSAPGTGKTFVLGGVIRELRQRGFKRFVYVTQNEDLVSQVQKNLADYGLEGVEFVTYAKSRTSPPSTTGSVLLLDEAHTAKNLGRDTGKKLASMVQSSDFTVYATATPFENVTEAEYIGYSGIFDDLKVQFDRPSSKPGGRPFRNELYGFKAWAWMFGANVYFVKQEDRSGEARYVPIVWWDKQQTSEEDQLAANEWLKKRGVYVQRPMALPLGVVNSELRSVEADPYWADISNKVVQIYADAESEAENNVESGQIKAHKANVLKRLLEASKVDAAIARAKDLIGEGKKDDPQVIIFVNTKADTDIGTYTLSEPYRKEYGIKGKDAKRRYTPSEMDDMMQRWYQAKAIAKQMGDDAGPPPFAPFVHKIAMAMDAAGVMEKFPSVIDKIMDAFPGQAVEYSGRTASQNSDNLAKWKNNEAKLIVATMDKGGTGLSFHDTTGTMPSRYQVNMNLPWSGTKVEQVSGRLARYGTAKPVNIEWIFANNIPFDRELSKTVGSRMRSMAAAVQGRKSGEAKQIRDFDFEDSPVIEDNAAVAPWSDATVEDEGRWTGTSVNVSAKGKEEGYAGKVVRVLNKGETIEVQRDGFDAAVRVPAERVSIVDLVDNKPVSVQQSDKAAKILADMESNQERMRQDKKQREGEKLANWIKAFEGSPREVTAAKDLFRKDFEKARENGVSDDRLIEIIEHGQANEMFTEREASDLKERIKPAAQKDATSQMHYPDGSAYRKWMSRRHELGDHPTSYLSGHSSEKVREAAKQNPGLGLVITPANPSYVDHAGDYSHVMVDNGAFSEFTGKAPFSEDKFFALLDRIVAAGLKDKVQFVVVPDRVGSWSGTNERWEEFNERVRAYGMPLAYVGQDGIEQHLDEIPWEEFDVFFIGGSTPWKLGYDPSGEYKDFNRPTDDELRKAGLLKSHVDLIEEAKRRGKKIHIGRVNSFRRIEIANYGMQVDSADGNYIGAAPDKNLPVVLGWLNDTGGEMFKQKHELLLDRAAKYREKGQSYKRDIADPAMRLQMAIANGNPVDGTLVQSLAEELEIRLDYWEPILQKAEESEQDQQDDVNTNQEEGLSDEEQAQVDSGSKEGDGRTPKDQGGKGRIVGAKTKVGKRAAHYEVVEISALIGSHHPFGMAVNEDFPKEWQKHQRRYELLSEAEKLEIWMPRGGFDPSQVIDTTRWHDRGPTMAIEKDGKLFVVGGTRRYMMIANIYRSFEDKALEYQNALVAEADMFGLNAASVNGMDRPILIRVIEEPGDVALLVDQLNSDAQFAKDPASESASLGRGIGKNTTSVLRAMEDEETLAKFLDRKGVDVVQAMAKDNVELKTKMPSWIQNNSLTKEAKIAVQKAIIGAVISDATLLSQASPRILQSVNGALPEILLLNQKGGEWSLTDRIKEAITYDAEFRSTGKASNDRNIDYWMNDPQQTFLEDFKKDPSSDGYRLWRYLLNYGGARKFRSALQRTMLKEARLDDTSGGLFADFEESMTGNQAFDLLVSGSDTPEEQLDEKLKNPPEHLFQEEPDIGEQVRTQALDLGIAALKAGVKNFEDFVAYSVDAVGEARTRFMGLYLEMVGKTVGMQGVRPTKYILGVPLTKDQYVQLAMEAFLGSYSVTSEQVEAGIEAAMLTGLPQMAVGFSPAGASAPRQSLLQSQPRLSVLHNLSADNLVFADRMGGLAVPSLAVVKEDMGLDGYGEITLIGRGSLVDPESVEVRDADAYTSRFPEPEYKKAKRSVVQKLIDQIRPMSETFSSRSIIDSLWDNAINRPNPSKSIYEAINSNPMKAWFLSEKGIETQPVMSPIPPRWDWVYSPSWINFVKTANHAVDNLGSEDPSKKQYLKDAGSAAVAAMQEAAEDYRKPGFEQNRIDRIVEDGRKAFLDEDGRLFYSYLHSAMASAEKMGKMQVDTVKTTAKLNKLLEGMEQEFKSWVESKILPMYGQPFLRDGRKLVDYNLDNIVKKMTTGGTTAKEKTMSFGEGMARAAASSRISSLDEMRNRSGSISRKEDMEAGRELAKKALYSWRDSVIGYYKYNDTWDALDASMRAIAKWAKGRDLASALRSEGFVGVPKNIVVDGIEAGRLFMNAPVPYFEAKPHRIVQLGEFAGAVIPEDASEQVLEILKKNDIPFKAYSTKGAENQRESVVINFRKELDASGGNVLFQNQQDNFDQPSGYGFNESDYRPAVVAYAKDKWGDAIAPNGKPTWQNFVRWFGDSAVVDKDGKPLVVYHGGSKTIDDNIIRTPFFYMTANRDEAEHRSPDATLHEFYVKMSKPHHVNEHLDNFMDWREYARDLEEDGDVEFAEELLESTGSALTLVESLKSTGFDGIIMLGEVDENYKNYIAFDPSQIKSATGNVGTFDANNPNILMQQDVGKDDAAYLDAVENGDMKTAQKMVDEAIEKAGEFAGGVSPVVYHGSPHADFYEFQIPSKGFNSTVFGSYEVSRNAAFFTADKEVALRYQTQGGRKGGSVRKFNVFGEMLDLRNGISDAQFNTLVENGVNSRWLSRTGASWELFDKEQDPDGTLVKALQKMGYDGAIIKDTDGESDFDSYVAFSPSQIKSADPVTYDDAGNVVPLSERFDDMRSDVRFQKQSQGGNVKGWTKFISGTRALIGATSKADISTVIHEFAHPIRRFLLDRKIPQDQRADITDEEIEMLEKKCGAGSVIDGKWVTKWDVPAEEKFARMWEQYWFEGKSPNSLLNSLFEKISRWMRGVYQSIQQITGGPLAPEVRELFDKLVQRGLTPEQRSAPIGAEQETLSPVPMAHEDELTSNANAVAEETRAILGIKGYADPARESFQQWIDEAKSLLRQDPTLGERLRAELSKKARSLTKVEEAVLSIHLRHIKNLIDRTSDRLFAAKDAKDSVAAAQALRETDMLVNQFEELTDAINRSGSETARALVARKIALRSDFTQGNLLRMARIANGGKELGKEKTEEIIALSRRIAELEGQLEKKTQEAEDLERKLAVQQSIDEDKKDVGGKPSRNSLRKKAAEKAAGLAKKLSGIFVRSTATDTLQQTEDEQLAEEAADVIKAYVDAGVYSFGEFMSKFKKDIGMEVPVSARAAFSTVWAEMREQGDIPTPQLTEPDTPEVRRIARMLQRSLVEDGITEPDEVIEGVYESLQEILPEITRREAMDAMSGYGQYSKLSPEPNDAIIRDLNGQYQQMAKLDDMRQGMAPKKTGGERRTPSDKERELIQQVNQMKRNSKYFITDPESQLKSIFQSTRTALRNRIYDLDRAINVTGTPIPGRSEIVFSGEEAKEIAELRKRRDELMAEYKRTFPKPGATFEQRAAAAERAADRAIAEIEKEIASGKMIVKGRPEPISTPALNAKLARLDALKAAREAAFESQIKEREEQRAEKAYIANLLARIADYEDRKRQGYFEPRAKKERRKLSPQEVELSRQLADLKDEFFRLSAEYRLANMGKVEKAWDNTKETMHLSRAIMTSMDLGHVFRQGGIASLAHPRLAFDSAREMRSAIFSQDAEFKSIDDIEKDSLYSFAMRCGLPITTNKGKIERQEEAYMGRLVRYGLGKKGTKLNKFTLSALRPVAASSRAYTVFLNSLRFRLFKYLVSNLGVDGAVTEDEGRVIAEYVGVATGRSELGRLNQVAANMSILFFAPRYAISRFQYFAMPFYLFPSTKVSGRVKKLIAMEYARHAMSVGAFLGLSVVLGSLLTDDEEEKPTVELDPRSSDWMKLKIGDTRIDPMAGLSQTMTLIGQVGLGQKKDATGEIRDLYGTNRKFGDPDLWEVGTKFVRKKLAPIPGAIVDLRVGENVIGEKETPISVATDLFVPLSASEAIEAWKARGVVGGTALTALALLGMGGGTYGPRTAYATADKAKRLELFNKDLDSVKWDSKDPAYSDFLTVDELEKFKKKREQRKQSLAYAASADPKRKEHASDESFKQSVSERDKAMETLMKSGMTFSEVRQLLIDYYRRNYGSAYETVGGTYGMKKSLVNRLRQIRSKMGQVPAAN